MSATSMTACDQCGSIDTTTQTDYGDLCGPCAFRQGEHDNARDSFDHLTASTFGFLSDGE